MYRSAAIAPNCDVLPHGGFRIAEQDHVKMTKTELRKLHLQRRAALKARALMADRLSGRVIEMVDFSAVKIVHCFISAEKFNEIDTRPLFEKIWSNRPTLITVVPRLNAEFDDMHSVVYEAASELALNRWGIFEPTGGQIVNESDIDLVIVPGLAFDVKGHRVGYGNGFYDRFLARTRRDCRKIGVDYFPPVSEITNTGAHDIQVEALATPEAIFRFA